MERTHINEKEFIAIGILFLNAVGLVFGVGKLAGKDSWIAATLGGLALVPIIYMFKYIIKDYPTKNLFEIIELILGKYLGKLVIWIWVIFDILMTKLVLLSIMDFINITALFYTPVILLAIIFLFCTYVLLSKDIKVIGNWSELVTIIFMIFLIVSFISVYKVLEFKNILPVWHNNFYNIKLGVIESIAYTYSGISILFVFVDEISDRNKIGKCLFIILSLTIVISIIIAAESVMVLGPVESVRSYFVNFVSYRRVSIGKVFQRVEIVLSITFIISEVVRVSIFLLFALKGLKHLLKLKTYRCVLVPIIMMLINLYAIEYQSIMLGGENEKDFFSVASCWVNLFPVVLIFIVSVAKKIGERIFNKKLI